MSTSQKTQEITSLLNKLLPEEIAQIESFLKEKDQQIVSLEQKLRWLEEQFKLSQQQKFGRSSETINSLQIELIFNECDEAQQSLPDDKEAKLETIHYTRRKPKQCGRRLDTTKLVRDRQLHDLPDSEKICACGCQLEKMGEDISEQVDHIPEQLKVIEHVRPKYMCRQCNTIKAAKKPEFPLQKSMASSALITDVILKKYEHHLPLYRQSKIYFNQGLEIPDNTLCNWVMGAAEVLLPLGMAAWEQLTQASYLQVDETPVKVLKPNKEGYMWVYHSVDPSNRFLLFEFTLTRASEHVNRRLNQYKGLLQTDGYSGYNGLRKHENVINFGCWDHCRRKFADVVKINGQNKSGKAGEMLILISKLYEIETQAKAMSAQARYALRQEKSKPLLELIQSRLQKINAPPQSALGKAVHYALNQWAYLSRYLDYGKVEISNCWIENEIRPFALGRRNWLFVGNEHSANKSALLYSLIQTCRINNIDPRKYLIYVLNQAHKMRRKEINPTSLLPQFINKNLL